jgi:tetratricopeptide (TPR) repeat protein
MNNGRQAEAEEALREARSVLKQVTVESPEAAHYHVALGGALNNLAILVYQARKSAEARDFLEEAIRHQRAALRINPRNKQALEFLANHYSSLSGVLLHLGETAKALDANRESIAAAERLVAEFPEFPDHRSSLAIKQTALGQLYFNTGHPEEAESAYLRALATMEKAAVDLPHAAVNKRMLAGIHNSLAMALEAKGRQRDALAEYRKSLQEHPDKVDALNNLAILLGDKLDLPSREPARAVELANRVVELQPKNWHWWRTLGVVRYRAGEWKGAVSALEKAQQLLGGTTRSPGSS